MAARSPGDELHERLHRRILGQQRFDGLKRNAEPRGETARGPGFPHVPSRPPSVHEPARERLPSLPRDVRIEREHHAREIGPRLIEQPAERNPRPQPRWGSVREDIEPGEPAILDHAQHR